MFIAGIVCVMLCCFAQAVDSLIGEVFDDVSFDEFEDNAVRSYNNL